MTFPAVGRIDNQYEIVNQILADAGIDIQDLQGGQYTEMVNAVQRGNFDFGISTDASGRPIITGLGQGPQQTGSDECAHAKIPVLCRAQRSLEGALSDLPPLSPYGLLSGSGRTMMEDNFIRLGIAFLGVGLVIAGVVMLAGKQAVTIVSGGSGNVGDAVTNVKKVARKGVVLFATKNPAAAAATP
jgi:hypothetical protein